MAMPNTFFATVPALKSSTLLFIVGGIAFLRLQVHDLLLETGKVLVGHSLLLTWMPILGELEVQIFEISQQLPPLVGLWVSLQG